MPALHGCCTSKSGVSRKNISLYHTTSKSAIGVSPKYFDNIPDQLCSIIPGHIPSMLHNLLSKRTMEQPSQHINKVRVAGVSWKWNSPNSPTAPCATYKQSSVKRCQLIKNPKYPRILQQDTIVIVCFKNVEPFPAPPLS